MRDTPARLPLPSIESLNGLAPEDLSTFVLAATALVVHATARLATYPASRPDAHMLASVEDLLTIPQVAERLQVPRQHAYELARRGELVSVRFGKYVRVRPTDLEEWIARHREQG